MTKIQSLEEINIGNIVQVNNLLYIVVSDGDVPQHRVTEVALCPLYNSRTPDSEVSGGLFRIRESHLKEFRIRKVNPKKYIGWKYKAVKTVGT